MSFDDDKSFALDEIISSFPNPIENYNLNSSNSSNNLNSSNNSRGMNNNISNLYAPKTATLHTTKSIEPKNDNKYIEWPISNIINIPIESYIRFYDLKDKLIPGGGKIKDIKNTPEGIFIYLLKTNSYTKKMFVKKFAVSEMSKIYRYILNNGQQNNGQQNNGQQNDQQNNGQQNGQINNDQQNQPISNFNEMINQAILPSQNSPLLPQNLNPLEKIGNNVLFNDTEALKIRIDKMENTIDQLSKDLKRMFQLFVHLNKKK